MWNVKDKSETKCNHLKVIQKIPEQHTRKAWNPASTENSHTEHLARTWESTDVEVQNIQRRKYHYMYNTL
jgi:hypothetical protein